MRPNTTNGRVARALCVAIAGLALIPSAASATPPGQEGRIVLHPKAGEGTLSLIDPVPDSTPVFPPALSDAGEVAGSADGQRLAAAMVAGTQQMIVLAKHDGTGVTPVSGTENGLDPTFSPDGQTLAFTRGGRIRTIPVTGGTATAVGPTIDDVHGLDWSPDGTRIVFVTGRSDDGDADLGLLDVATGEVTALTDTADTNEEHPSWSPDGTRLAYQQSIEDSPVSTVKTMADDGSDVRTVTTEAGLRSIPVYSPTGARIAYVDDHGHVTTRPVAGGPTAQIGDGEQRASDLVWLVKPGTGNQPPTADFAVTPEFPRAGAPATFTASATDADGTIGSYAWDLDGDGAFDDGAAQTAQMTYPTVGARSVRLRVRDNLGLAATVTKQVTVVEPGKPVAFFSYAPERPATASEVVFTAAVNDDPGAVAVRHQWDFDGNGAFDADTAAGREARWTYAQPGTYNVKLRVTDADGDQTDHAVGVNVVRATECGRAFGRMAIAGCVEVNGDRGLARDGLTINGVTLVAPAGSAIVVDRSAQGNTIRAIDAAAAEDYLRGAGAAPPMDARSVAVSVCGERLGAAALNLTEVSNAARAQTLAVTAAADAAIAGMKVAKVGDIAFAAGSAALELEGRFPRIPLSPGATGRYELSNDCEARRLHIKTNDLLFNTIQLTDVDLERIGGGRELKGTLGLRIPVVGFGLRGSIDLSDGAITRLRIAAEDVASLGAGLDVAEISLQLRLRGGSVAQVTGGAKVATKGKLFGRRVASTDGYLTVGDGSVRIDGHLNVFDIPIGFGYIEAGLGWVDMGVGIDGELGPAFVEVMTTGYLNVYPPGINLEGRGRAGFRGIGTVGAEGLISTKGGGVCGEFDTFLGTVRPGVTFQFAEDILEPRLQDMDLNIFVKGCDLGPIRVARTARAAAADGAQVVEMPGRLPSASVQVTGADGPPKVTLVAPNGEKIETPADDSGRKTGRFILVQDARSRTTTIVVVKPPAGDWRVVPAAGSTAIRSVGLAEGLPQPKVTTRVSGKGMRRTLRWRLRRIPGQRVQLLETGRHGSRRLVATNRARGMKRFKPAAGLGSKRRIVAFVEQGGLPRRKLRGGRYTVRVAKVVPKRPRSARWSMTADALRVTFKAAAKRLDHEVTVVRADGLRRVELVPAKRHAVTLPGLWEGERIRSVTVRAVGPDGRRSAPRAARR